MTDPFDHTKARDRLLEQHDLQADAEEAHALLDEVLADWDGLDHSGRIARIREAGRILSRTLDRNRMQIDREHEDDEDGRYCPDCGADESEFGHEEIGSGQARFYCTGCDRTLQVG